MLEISYTVYVLNMEHESPRSCFISRKRNIRLLAAKAPQYCSNEECGIGAELLVL
jgi:hypothetical protein